MKDHRLTPFRSAVDALIESLDAVIRLSRWTEAEPAPDPLVTSASKLVERLGAADRLVSSRFVGPPTDTSKVATMCAAMKRLDAAYRTYRQQTETFPDRAADATAVLEAEVGTTSDDAVAWR